MTEWSIKVLKVSSKSDFYVGVVPFDIDQDREGEKGRGWYFSCRTSELYSGPPHKYCEKKYGPDKKETKYGKYNQKNDVIGVVIDTKLGNISFVLDGKDCGPAYEKIPLDKPLVPCVLLNCAKDSVELTVSGSK